MPNSLIIPNPPPSACGDVVEGGIYLRGIGGGGWGGGGGGILDKIRAIWPARGDDTHVVTGTTKRSVVRVVEASAVWNNAPEEDWLVAGSRAAYLDRKWDKEWREMFGMPWSERKDNGVLESVSSIEGAQKVLMGLTISNWDNLNYYATETVRACLDTPAYDDAMAIWRAVQANQPAFYILARIHQFLRGRNVPFAAVESALKAMRTIAFADSGWMRLRLNDEAKPE